MYFSISEAPFLNLIQNLRDELKHFFKEELQLLKTELSEKTSRLRHYGTALIIGGLIAYAGMIILLGAVGFGVAFVFEKLGVERLLAVFAGLGLIGFIVSIIGLVLLSRAVKILSKESLLPEKTLSALKKESNTMRDDKRKDLYDEIQADIHATEKRMSETTGEIGRRLSPNYLKEQLKQKIQAHPFKWNFAAACTGLLSILLLKRRFY